MKLIKILYTKTNISKITHLVIVTGTVIISALIVPKFISQFSLALQH